MNWQALILRLLPLLPQLLGDVQQILDALPQNAHKAQALNAAKLAVAEVGERLDEAHTQAQA